MKSERRQSKHPGDGGKTSICGQSGLSKGDLRVEVLGSLDEVQAWLGLARAKTKDPETARMCLQIQKMNQIAMGELSYAPKWKGEGPKIESTHVSWLEEQIMNIEKIVKLPGGFVISGNTISGAIVDGLRTIVRRAERNIVRLFDEGGIQNLQLLAFYNRLSTLCFYLEIHEDQFSN